MDSATTGCGAAHQIASRAQPLPGGVQALRARKTGRGRAEMARPIRSVFDSPSRSAADQLLKELVAQYAQSAPRLAAWMERNVPQSLTVLVLPVAHQKRLRTSNSLERANQEIKRRTCVARMFPNEASLLRLVTALLAEISEEWEIGKIYLTMENLARTNAL